MNTKEALKRLYDCAYDHHTDFSEHMDDMDAYQFIESRIVEIEAVENELGVDLITLFKALKNGIWSKGGFYDMCYLDNKPVYIPPKKLEIGRDLYVQYDRDDNTYQNEVGEENAMCLYSHDYEEKVYSVRIKDYDKTWALTKEELL